MPTDAKLGMLAGVGLVLAIAMVFFRQEALAPRPHAERARAASVRPLASGTTTSTTRSRGSRSEKGAMALPVLRRHVVRAGETLPGLAERFYGDKDKADRIRQANLGALKQDADPTPGTSLAIPE